MKASRYSIRVRVKREAARQRREAVANLRASGTTLREIAAHFHITPERVRQIVLKVERDARDRERGTKKGNTARTIAVKNQS